MIHRVYDDAVANALQLLEDVKADYARQYSQLERRRDREKDRLAADLEAARADTSDAAAALEASRSDAAAARRDLEAQVATAGREKQQAEAKADQWRLKAEEWEQEAGRAGEYRESLAQMAPELEQARARAEQAVEAEKRAQDKLASSGLEEQWQIPAQLRRGAENAVVILGQDSQARARPPEVNSMNRFLARPSYRT